jgi:hypothetical protein
LKQIKTLKTSKKNEKDLDFVKIKNNNLEEFQLIRLLINYGELAIISDNKERISTSKFIVSELESDAIQFSIPVFNQVFNEIKNNIKSNESISKDYFLTHLDKVVRDLTSYIIGEQYFLSNWKNKDIIVLEEKDILLEVTKESILRFKLQRVQEMVKESLLKLKNDDNEAILKQFTRLNQLEKKIHKELGRLF